MFNVDFGNDMFHGMFAQVGPGCCKIGMNGKVAIKTSTGYKTFDTKTNRLTNCNNFAFNADGAFWILPAFKVEKGDIIFVNKKPCHVIEVGDNSIKAFSYEDSTVNEVVPERHVFMGKTYCYGKLFSPFMNMSKKDGTMNDFMKMVMMSKMFSGSTNSSNDFMGMNPMMLMMMGGNNNFLEGMFDGAFDFGTSTEEEVVEESEE